MRLAPFRNESGQLRLLPRKCAWAITSPRASISRAKTTRKASFRSFLTGAPFFIADENIRFPHEAGQDDGDLDEKLPLGLLEVHVENLLALDGPNGPFQGRGELPDRLRVGGIDFRGLELRLEFLENLHQARLEAGL